jgi:hypothetical protein
MSWLVSGSQIPIAIPLPHVQDYMKLKMQWIQRSVAGVAILYT